MKGVGNSRVMAWGMINGLNYLNRKLMFLLKSKELFLGFYQKLCDITQREEDVEERETGFLNLSPDIQKSKFQRKKPKRKRKVKFAKSGDKYMTKDGSVWKLKNEPDPEKDNEWQLM